MSEPLTFICGGCSSRLRGPPAATAQRPSGREYPVCEDCIPKLMPSQNELEAAWWEAITGRPYSS